MNIKKKKMPRTFYGLRYPFELMSKKCINKHKLTAIVYSVFDKNDVFHLQIDCFKSF